MASKFLELTSTLRAIRRLANEPDLTLVIGAGSSAEAGLPTWPQLAHALLVRAAERLSIAKSLRPEFCEWIMKREGLIGSAAIAQAILKDDFLPATRDELYRIPGADPPPGPTAKAVAALQHAWDDRCQVVTPNFDQILEKAIQKRFPRRSVRSEWLGAAPSGRELLVHHLHGVLTMTEERSVVLAESGYYLTPADSWQEVKMRGRLSDTACVFAGVSMLDHDLLRWVYRSATNPRHVALLTRQTDVQEGRPDVADPVLLASERAAYRRWQATGITALNPDYFVQSAQFLYEVGFCRTQRADYVPYGERLRMWEEEVDQGILRTDDKRRFTEGQDRLQALLRQWLDRVVRNISARTTLADDERLGLHLWVRRPRSHSLMMWGSSDRSWRDVRTLEAVPIAMPSPWVAVRGFCAGSNVVSSTSELTTSRWNSVHAVPVFLEGEPWHRLPVGVITLASTRPINDSALANIGPEDLNHNRDYLARNAADVLNPRGP
ncbi:MAG: hypothetical protein QOK28_2020 [Actinomycetota bacterium]